MPSFGNRCKTELSRVDCGKGKSKRLKKGEKARMVHVAKVNTNGECAG